MYNEPGLGSGASYGSGYPTAAAVGHMQPSMALSSAMLMPNVQNKGKFVNATPGHLVLGCHAFTLAAIQVEMNVEMT